ncbi:MAG TPA: hypothetical protein VIG80_09415 [Bacillaceae bacterium]
MYTYETLAAASGAFTLMRPVFTALLIFSLLLLFTVIFKRTLVNGAAVIGFAVVFIVVAAQLLYYSAIIVDELGLAGDLMMTNLFLGIAAVNVLNPVLYYRLGKR